MTAKNPIYNPNDDTLLNEDISQVTDGFLKNGKIPHAILLSGNEWIGKLHNALFFARKLLSYNPKTREVLENINVNDPKSPIKFKHNSITELFMSSVHHPDLLLISKNDNDKNISIEQIREITKFLSLTPSCSSFRIAIINPVEEMSINSSNALLKALEEPAENTVLILITHNKHKILDTIKSRCICLDFKNLKDNVYYDYFTDKSDEYNPEKVKNIRKISNNSPFIAKAILDDQSTEIYQNFKSLLEEEHININKLSTISKNLKDDKSGKTEQNFFKILLSEHSSKVKANLYNQEGERLTYSWFKILKTYNQSKSFNLDIQDTLKEIINIIKYI